jgi:hypothetical protein
MFRSLRFRLPALFLVGIVLAGLISTLIAVKLFQDYARGRKFSELERESIGLAQLYGDQAGHRAFSSKGLVKATGDTIFYSGLTPPRLRSSLAIPRSARSSSPRRSPSSAPAG